jgi:plastocyanin
MRLSANRVLSLFIFAAALALANSFSTLSQDNSSVVVIRMTNDMKFVPEQVTIKAGQTIEWVNDPDGPSHTVTTDADKVADPRHVSIPNGAKPFDSGVIKSGKSFRYMFTIPGVYRYACQPHEGMMLGEITVTE